MCPSYRSTIWRTRSLYRPDHGAVDLGFDARRERGGVDQVSEKHCQSANFALVERRGEEILGIGIAAVDRQHLLGQTACCGVIALADGPECAIEQFVDLV